MTLLTSALSYIFAPFIGIGLILGSALAPEPVQAPVEQAPALGASEAIPTTIAFFETTLASAITSDATSFNLTSATDKDGTLLASSTYAFVIDEGSSNEEIVMADCTGTACVRAERGISVRTGNTEVASLKKAHRRGASVKITDAPSIPLITRILRGEGQVDFTPSTGGSLVTKDYVDGLSFGGTVPVASLTDDGVAELSTGIEAASSTYVGGSGSPLMLNTRISTSTGGTAYTIPVTGSTGKLDSGFISSSSVTQYAIWRASTTVFTVTGVYTKATGVKFVEVQVQGAGGDGGTGTDSTGGGGGGGYAFSRFLPSELGATTNVTVGTAGIGTGSTTFGAVMLANNGGDGGDSTGGTGGTVTGGNTLNISGSAGQTADAPYVGGFGGNSVLGKGAPGGAIGSGTSAGNAGSAFGYGAGGGGAGSANDTDPDGSPSGGTAGIVIITEYF